MTIERPINSAEVQIVFDDGSLLRWKTKSDITREELIERLRRLLDKIAKPALGQPPSLDAVDPSAADPGKLTTRVK